MDSKIDRGVDLRSKIRKWMVRLMKRLKFRMKDRLLMIFFVDVRFEDFDGISINRSCSMPDQ